MGLEDKPLMDEFVALYIGMSSNKRLEQQFREQLSVSIPKLRKLDFNQYGVVERARRGSLPLDKEWRHGAVRDQEPADLYEEQ